MLAASGDELGKLVAEALEERKQLGLLFCIAIGGTGRKHEEPRDFCYSAAQGLLLCCGLLEVATESVVARAPVPASSAGTEPVASAKAWSNISAIGTDHLQSSPSLFFIYSDISLSNHKTIRYIVIIPGTN
jgi:hypothetical protein